jgi:hypothetical protein
MSSPRKVLWSLALIAAAGCGGAGGSQGGSSSLADATPSSALLNVSLDGSSATAMPVATGAAALDATATASEFPPVVIGDDGCHPHLFLRTEAVARRINRHLYKLLGRIDRLVLHHPVVDSSGQMVWEVVRASGLDERFTITKVADLTYAWRLELRQGTAGDFTTVFSGQVDRTSATGKHQGKGEATLDLTALHAVIPAEPAQGVIGLAFDVSAASRQVELTASDVVWDRDGDPSSLPDVAPRNAHYVFLREPGKGGSLKAADQMVFLCPANPELDRADVDLVHRWTVLGDGSRHGRSDAQMLGGQLTATERVAGVTCHTTSAADAVTEGFWQMKLEDGGVVVAAGSHQSGTSDPCDPVFGAVPDLYTTTGDLDFSAIDFGDSTPYPFPGM